MQEHLVVCIDASSAVRARVGPARFRSAIRRALEVNTGLSPMEIGFASAECAHRAWVASYVGGSWSSLLLVIGAARTAATRAIPPRPRAMRPWHVVLVPEGCSLREEAGQFPSARARAAGVRPDRLRGESGSRNPWPAPDPAAEPARRRGGACPR
jgi:hypothetical protein